MRDVLLFARNEEANKWLAEHPAALGCMFLAIGLAVGGWGVREMLAGVAHGKYGHRVEGNQAKIIAIMRIVAGAVCVLFGLYKLLLG